MSRYQSMLIPVSLAKLLAAKPKDLKNPKRYRFVKAAAEAQLRLLMALRGIK